MILIHNLLKFSGNFLSLETYRSISHVKSRNIKWSICYQICLLNRNNSSSTGSSKQNTKPSATTRLKEAVIKGLLNVLCRVL